MPPSDDTWQKIQDNFSQLLINEAFTPFHPLLERLQQLSSARAYPPELFEDFVKLLPQMSFDIQHGQSIGRVLDRATSGTYMQPNWDVHGGIIQFVLNNFRKEIEIEKPEPIPIPIVLLAMNATEAQELLSGVAF